MGKQYSHGEKQQVEDRQVDEELKEKQKLEDIKKIMNMPEGKRMFQEMFTSGHIEDPFFKGNSSDAYNLGMRAIVLHYWNLCKEADPGTFYELILEKTHD